jgi:thiol-disulfide isomerase/thioredoxin
MNTLFKRATLMLISLGLLINIKAQSMYPGDTWPNLQFKEVLNYHKPTLEFADFPGKVFLIDLWSHSCSACIAAFPHLDSLQAQFKDQLQIIMFNPESRDSTIRFFKRKNKIYVPKNIPMVTGEKEFTNKLNDLGNFWLDSSRVLKYTGDLRHTTASNVQKFLAQIPLTFKQTRLVTDLNTDVPLIAEGEGRWLDSVNFYSYLFHHEFHMSSLQSFIPGKMGPPNRLCLANFTISGLYRAAFNQGSTYDHASIPMEIRIKDSSLFFPPTGDHTDENWLINHQYTYDLKVPLPRSADIYIFMQQDLDRYFGLKAKVQILERECWVLEPLKNRLFVASGGKPYSNTGRRRNDTINIYKNWPADDIVNDLKESLRKFSLLPLVNHLYYSGPMNFEIPHNVLLSSNMDLFKKALAKNGLALRRTKAKTPVLVITD